MTNEEFNYEAARQALEDHKDGKTVGQYNTAVGGGIWESAAYNQPFQVVEESGVDVVDGTTTNYLLTVETEDARHIDSDIENLDIEEVFEYEVSVKMFDREGGKVMEGEPTILSGTSSETGPEEWAEHALERAYENADIDSVKGNGSNGGDVKYLLDEEKPTGIEALDTV